MDKGAKAERGYPGPTRIHSTAKSSFLKLFLPMTCGVCWSDVSTME